MARLSEKPIYLKQNPYRGPNAHLLSLQQTPRPNVSLWHSFHNQLIVFMTQAITKVLPQGYVAINDQSLQIQARLPNRNIETLPPRYPDVAVYARTVTRTHQTGESAILNPDLFIPYEAAAPNFELDAVVIYQATDNEELRMPIVRIELLSPSNKPNGGDVNGYLRARDVSLASGTILYELDILHESASPLRGIPVYPDQSESHPYTIAVTDPGRFPIEMLVKGFNVDERFPPFDIVLLGTDRVHNFDLTDAYNNAFGASDWAALIDYADDPDPRRALVMKQKFNRSVPPALAAYSPVDQARIAERMRAIVASVENPTAAP